MTLDIKEFCDLLAANENHRPPPDFDFDDEAKLVEFFNSQAAVIQMGDQVRIATFERDGRPQFLRQADAALLFKPHKFVWQEEEKWMSKDALGVWLDSPQRRKYSAVVFKPQGAAPDELNLFTGFAITPAPGGSCSLLYDHILNNICLGNEVFSRWLLGWMAQIFQEPGVKPGTAVALKGEMGVGKSIISDVLGTLIGDRYAPALDQSDQVTGRFNGHLEETLLGRVEEGFFAGDPKARSTIKHIITSRTLQYERKNLNAYQAPSYTRILLTTNESWAVSAAPEERRWFVLNVGNAKRQDRAYFGALIAELEAGGYEAFLHDLMNMDISDIDLRNPPKTEALMEQIIQGFTAEQSWWMMVLEDGALPSISSPRRQADWIGDKEFEVEKSKVAASYREHVTGFRGRGVTDQQIGAFLSKTVDRLRHTRPTIENERRRCYVFPPLAELREAFAKATGYAFEQEEETPPLRLVGGSDVTLPARRPGHPF